MLHFLKSPLNLNRARCYKVRYIALAILRTEKFKISDILWVEIWSVIESCPVWEGISACVRPADKVCEAACKILCKVNHKKRYQHECDCNIPREALCKRLRDRSLFTAWGGGGRAEDFREDHSFLGGQKRGSALTENPKGGIAESFGRIQRSYHSNLLGKWRHEGRGGDRESHQKVLGGITSVK